MAGINAHRALQEASPIVLQRDQAYIGVLIDDLITKRAQKNPTVCLPHVQNIAPSFGKTMQISA